VRKKNAEMKKKEQEDNKVEEKYVTSQFDVIVNYPQKNGKPDIVYKKRMLEKFVLKTSNKNLERDIKDYLMSEYDDDNYGDDSWGTWGKTDASSVTYNTVSKSQFSNAQSAVVSQVRMRHAYPVKFSFMEHVNPISFQTSSGLCVPDALRLRYASYKKFDLSNEHLEEEFRKIINDDSNGKMVGKEKKFEDQKEDEEERIKKDAERKQLEKQRKYEEEQIAGVNTSSEWFRKWSKERGLILESNIFHSNTDSAEKYAKNSKILLNQLKNIEYSIDSLSKLK
jgi:hypothetical protein